MSRSSRHQHRTYRVVSETNLDDSPFRVDPTTTFAHWIRAWLNTGALGITDVMTVPDLAPNNGQVVVMAYRLPKDASDLADLMAQSLADLVHHGVISAAGLALALPEPDLAPSSNTGRTATDQQSQEGEEGLINSAIEALIKLRRDRASGL